MTQAEGEKTLNTRLDAIIAARAAEVARAVAHGGADSACADPSDGLRMSRVISPHAQRQRGHFYLAQREDIPTLR
jgi:hypothetical protein